MSRRHARIVVTNGEAILEDLGSKNGTHVNGSRVATPCRLADGDEVRLGGVILTFRLGSPMSATETVPVDSA
jgi:pSer/pThr/pTyr-binding forkhead associated (FHA) protein